MKRVVIVGSGFGGLNVARKLSGVKDVHVLILDRRNHHLFQPLLYQVAMAGLNPADIASPIRSLFRRARNVEVLLEEVTSIDLSQRLVNSRHAYDYLALACGAEHSYFQHNEWEDFAPGLKTLEQATEMRRRILLAFEQAELAAARGEDTSAFLTFVIIGAGPTGVELAGALSEITRFTLKRDFRFIDPRNSKVVLVEAGPRILASFPEDLSRRALNDLKNMGVIVRLGARVSDVQSEGVRIGDEWLPARTTLWAAGVRPSPLNTQLGEDLDAVGRVKVTSGLHLKAHPNVFVIGDQAITPDALPGLAPVAMQQGRYVGDRIRRLIAGSNVSDFVYIDKGQMATIGRKKAVAMIRQLHFAGLFAWLLWLFIHIYFLIGFRNRVAVLWGWTYSYLTYRKGARLITDRDWHLRRPL